MKLSLKKKLGHVHVRGGKLVRVLTPHRVSTAGYSSRESNQPADMVTGKKPAPRFHPGQKYEVAQEGDLALEIVRVNDKVRIGYSYLSGGAILLNSYFDQAWPVWFEEAKLVYVDLDDVESMEDLTKAVLTAQWGGHDVGAFFRELPSEEHAKGATQTILEIMKSYRKVERDGHAVKDVREAHVLGLVVGGKASYLIHNQPEKDASPHSATSFQVALVLSALGKLPDRS